MRAVLNLATFALAATIGAAGAAAASPASSSPPPASAARESVEAINIATLRQWLEAAGATITTGTFGEGVPYLAFQVGPINVFADLLNCVDNNVNGACESIRLEASLTNGAVDIQHLNAFNRQGYYTKAISYEADNGRATVQWVVSLPGGITSHYFIRVVNRFAGEAQHFYETVASVEVPMAAATTQSFSGPSPAAIGSERFRR